MSRWLQRPEHVTESPGDLPKGFKAAGVAAGIKPSGGMDVGLLVCSEPDCVSATRFTRSGILAAPVVLTKQRARQDAIRVVIVNSGNANAATGNQGYEQAARTQGAAAMAGGVREDQVAVASTGVIGVQLDAGDIIRGIVRARGDLREYGHGDFSEAIQTTDQFAKEVEVDVALSGGTVRLTAQAKGAGMISPNFATMLCFVQTDAALEAKFADLLLGLCVERSFDRISVDGQLSTNDTVIFQASGASGVPLEADSEDATKFGEALDWALRKLALDIVRDGEGSKRIGRVVVRGGSTDVVENAARAIANSPLVKAALHGGDPNWGRIVQAVGGVLTDTYPLAVDVFIESVQVCAAGMAIPFDQDALNAAVDGDEVEYDVVLPGSGAETEVFFSDLSHEYVSVNADYTT